MATRGKGGQSSGGGKKPARKKTPGGKGSKQEKNPELGNPDADPVRIHREFVEQRTEGGTPPTEDAYRRALDQWHQLPGAVRRPATEVGPTKKPLPPGEDTEKKRDADSVEENGS